MRECTCSIEDYCDDCHTEFHKETIRTARKEHKCYECHKPILPGEKYEYVSAKWDGQISTVKTCSICLELRKAFFCSWMYGHIREALRDDIFENQGEVSSACILALSPEARNIVFEIIEEVWADDDENDDI